VDVVDGSVVRTDESNDRQLTGGPGDQRAVVPVEVPATDVIDDVT
jgi:hypothetical protein